MEKITVFFERALAWLDELDLSLFTHFTVLDWTIYSALILALILCIWIAVRYFADAIEQGRALRDLKKSQDEFNKLYARKV